MQVSRRYSRPILAAAVLVIGATRPASAAVNFVWTGSNGDSVYSTAANWIRLDTGASGAPGTAGNAIFADTLFDNVSGYSFTPTAPAVVSIPAAGVTVGQLSFGDSIAAKGIFTLASDITVGTAGTTITLNTGISRLGGGTDALTGGTKVGAAYLGTAGKQTINSNVIVKGSQSWAIKGDSGSVVLNGTVDNAAGQTITKSGGNRIEFKADNAATFLGNYVAQGGDTFVSHSNALGLGTSVIQVTGTAASNTANTAVLTNSGVTFTHDINVNTNPNGVTVTLGGLGSQTTSTWTGAIALGQSASLTGGTAGTTTFSGSISGGTTAVVTKAGNGTVVLTGTNGYTGPTTVNAGVLQIDGQQTGGGAYSVAAGATLRGNGTVLTAAGANGLTVLAGGTFAPAAAGGTFHVVGDVTLGGTLQVNLDALTATPLDIAGTLSIGDAAAITLVGGSALTADVYPLVHYASLNGIIPTPQVANLPAGYELVSGYAGDQLALVRSAAVPEPLGGGSCAAAVLAAMSMRRRSRAGRSVAVCRAQK